MKRVYVSSLYRLTELDNASGGELGHLYTIDWESKTVLNKKVMNICYTKGAPGGKSHGARGVTIDKDVLYVAGSDNTISKFDLDTMELIDILEFKEFSYIHQIKIRDGKVYVASTGTDRRYVLENDKIVDVLDLKTFDYILDNSIFLTRPFGEDRLHFNSIGWGPEGKEYHVYFAPSMVFCVNDRRIIYEDPSEIPSEKCILHTPHDIVFHKNKIIVNGSLTKETFSIDLDTGVISSIFKEGKRVEDLGDLVGVDKAGDNCFGFTRTLFTSDDFLFIGSIPLRLNQLKYNYETGDYDFVDYFDFSTTLYESIFDAVPDPRDW